MIKSRRMRLAGHVEHMGRKKRDQKEDLDVSGRIKLKWILKK
jgi:hypothetical protein